MEENREVMPYVSPEGLDEMENEQYTVPVRPLEAPKPHYPAVRYTESTTLPPSPRPASRPEFVLFGIADAYGGVILFASRKLTRSQLESKVFGVKKTLIGSRVMYLEDRRTTFSCEFADFTMIRSDTYIDALRSLLTTWRPPEAQDS
jgi:hypothetical protein